MSAIASPTPRRRSNISTFWELVKTDPELANARARAAALTPDPIEAIQAKAIARLFSPRHQCRDARLVRPAHAQCRQLGVVHGGVRHHQRSWSSRSRQKRDQMRFVLMEKPTPDARQEDAHRRLRPRHPVLRRAARRTLQHEGRQADGAQGAIQEFELDKWFFEEEHFRPKNDGFVFFVHTKFLLIDPLSDDPLVCSGSANFSAGSLLRMTRTCC